MKVLLSEQQIRDGVQRMGREVTRHYADGELTVIGVLNGSLVLLADLIRAIERPLQVGLIQARSYRGAATTPGTLSINADFLPEIRGRDALLVDDILDTGQTLLAMIAEVKKLAPRSVRTAVLLRKAGRQRVDVEPDHVAFEIPDAFVLGYGLDYRDAFRHLPYVAVLEDADLAQEPPA